MSRPKRGISCRASRTRTTIEPNGREVSCPECGRYFGLSACTFPVRGQGVFLPSHFESADDELAIPVIDAPAGVWVLS